MEGGKWPIHPILSIAGTLFTLPLSGGTVPPPQSTPDLHPSLFTTDDTQVGVCQSKAMKSPIIDPRPLEEAILNLWKNKNVMLCP